MATTALPETRPAAASRAASSPPVRIGAIDVVRGLAMVLMAIDHVRVYAGVPAGGMPAGVFLTRWVTHFCAPVFVFLAGTSAYLYGTRTGTPALARWLATRGALLVLLELTVIKWSWTFAADYGAALAGVIWMLGLCMLLLATMVRLAPRTLGIAGLAIVLLQSLLHPLANAVPALGPLWQLLYTGGGIDAGGRTLVVLYNLVPWIGVMMVGYGLGPILLREAAARKRWLLRAGTIATALFVVGGIGVAAAGGGNPELPFAFRVLDQNKYRDSQLFLLMTLGPALLLLAAADGARGRVSRTLAVFGRAPMWYYLLHIPLIHALSLLVWRLRDGTAHADWFRSAPFVQTPDGARWELGLLYLVFAVAVALLYPACAWYARRKETRPMGWMRYL
jgi:uncharacterized membrane protein